MCETQCFYFVLIQNISKEEFNSLINQSTYNMKLTLVRIYNAKIIENTNKLIKKCG